LHHSRNSIDGLPVKTSEWELSKKFNNESLIATIYMSSHAEDEMLDDGLERRDIDNAILKGRLEKKLTHDACGTRYRIEGPALDGRLVHVICRISTPKPWML
jgi:hypothetical protein